MKPLSPTLWRTCRVLAGNTRLALLRLILEDPDQPVSRLAERAGIGESDASQELRRLQSRGLLHRQPLGRSVFYQLRPDPLVSSAAPLLKALRAAMSLPRTREDELPRIAQALAHERRILIARELRLRPHTSEELSLATNIGRSALQRHVQLLIAGGFVRRKGRRLSFQSPKHPLGEALARLLS